jgi:hypothetical protein
VVAGTVATEGTREGYPSLIIGKSFVKLKGNEHRGPAETPVHSACHVLDTAVVASEQQGWGAQHVGLAHFDQAAHGTQHTRLNRQSTEERGTVRGDRVRPVVHTAAA